jgi:dipeptidyl-peptidase-4
VEPQGSPRWLEDGSLLWPASAAFKHLYRYAADGTQMLALTQAAGSARAPWRGYQGGLGLSAHRAQRARVDVTGCAPAAVPQRLSMPGTHTALQSRLQPLPRHLSDVHTLPQVGLYRADGHEVHSGRQPGAGAAGDSLSKPEPCRQERDGFVMEALLIWPPDFDLARRYRCTSTFTEDRTRRR